MSLFPSNEILQFMAWFLALIEFILALYILLLNPQHMANRHVGALLLLLTVNNFALGQITGATDAAHAALSAVLLAATSVAVPPALFLITVVLLKPEWLRARWRWIFWLVYGLVFLPALLTLIDVALGSGLWYTGLDPDTYTGGYVGREAYSVGSLSLPIRVLSLYLIGLAPLIPILYVLLRDKAASRMTRRLAWVLLTTEIVTLVIQFGLRDVLGPELSSLVVGVVLALGYAYAGFQQMISERRTQRGRLQPRLIMLVLALTVPLLVAAVGFLAVGAVEEIEQKSDEHLATTNSALAANVTTWLDLNVQALQQLVILPDIVSMDAGRQKPILEAMAAAHPHMYLVSTTDLDGINVARNDDEDAKDYRDRPWFQGPRDGSPLTFQSLVSRTTGEPALVASMPILNRAGEIVGVGMFGSELSDVAREVKASRVGETGFSYVVDADDKVIAHPDPAFSQAEDLVDLSEYPPVAALRQGTRGLWSFTDEQGERWLAYLSELENGWGVIVQQAEADVAAPLHALEWLSLIIVVFDVVVLVVLVGLTIRQAIRPIDALTETATAIAAGDLERVAPVESEDEIGTLARTFNSMTEQLRELIGSLESQVAERTHDLKQRSAYLEATADVGRAAASILETDQLVQRVVELIRERFGLYYVGLFMVERAGQAERGGDGSGGEVAVLRAGTGEAGRTMLARGHQIRVGEGMVGWSVAHAEPRVAMEVGADAVRLATAELPETRSEAALPLRSRGQVLGALTVQHTEPGFFDPDTMAVLQTMADQVAVALDNARLFTAGQEALQAAQRAYGEMSRQAWHELLRPRTDWGYRWGAAHGQQTVEPAGGAWRPEMLQAAQQGQVVQAQDAEELALAIPLRVRDQVVGVLGFRKGFAHGERQAWTDEERELLASFSAQLESALESARLYQETQRRAAEDRLLGEVTARMRQTLDVETVLQTAVREMGVALGLSRVEVRMSHRGNDHA